MKHHLKMSMLFLGKLKYFHKFVIIILIMVVVLIIFIGQLEFQSLSLISFTKNELMGLDYLSSLVRVTHNIQNYRYEELNYLLDPKLGPDKLVKAQHETDLAVSAMDVVNAKFGKQLKSSDEWTELRSEWMMIKEGHFIDPTKSNFDNSVMIVNNLSELTTHVCDASNITLDPEILTYYLGDTYCTKMPTYIQELTLIRDISTKAYLSKNLSANDHRSLIINEDLMDNFNKIAIKSNLDKITVDLENSTYLNLISTDLVNTLLSETTNLVGMIDGSLLANPVNLDKQINMNRYASLINVGYTLNNQVQQVLKLTLEARINKIYHKFYFNIGISLLALLLISYLFAGIYHSIVRNSRKLLHHAKKMEEGDFHNIIQIKTQDEMAKAAAHLDNMRHSFYVIISEINEVLEGIISGKNLSARAALDCEGSFDKLESNVNAMADLIEELVNHLNKLIEGAHLDTIGAANDSLSTTVVQASKLAQHSSDLIKSSQDDIQPYTKRINELLSELKIYRDEHESIKNDMHSLEDIVVQARILAISVAGSAESEISADKKNELIRFATEIRAMAEKMFTLCHVVKTIESADEKQRTLSADLIDTVNECSLTWTEFNKKMALILKNLMFDTDKQRHALKKLVQAHAQLQKIADDAKQALPSNQGGDHQKRSDKE